MDKEASQPCLSLCMIVRDSERVLDAALSGIREFVDEMVVVDTGSADKTPEIVRRHRARLFHFPWCDDFSAARNESIRHARGKWIFWMDSDDTIDRRNGQLLRQLAYRVPPPETLGYVMQVHCPAEDGHGATVVDHIKMFRNLRQLRFEGRIHEQILPAIRRAGGEVAWTDIFVTHSGADHSEEARRRKYERDLRLLQLDLQDRPNHPFVLFNLGMTYEEMGRYREAADVLRRCIIRSQRSESHVRKAYALLVSSLVAMEQHQEAWAVCRRGRQIFPNDPELLFRHALLCHRFALFGHAAEAYETLLRNEEARHFTSVDRGILGFKSRHNLAMVYTDMGRHQAAELQWRQVLEEQPNYDPARRAVVQSLLKQHKFAAAEAEIERLSDEPRLQCERIVLRSELAEARGDLPRARRELEAACRRFPQHVAPQQALCRFLFDHGGVEEAERALVSLAELCPDDPAAYQNLGVVYLRQGDLGRAQHALRKTLELRPNSAVAEKLLHYAWQLQSRAVTTGTNAGNQALAAGQMPTITADSDS